LLQNTTENGLIGLVDGRKIHAKRAFTTLKLAPGVKDKNPFGKAYSVQWATDRVYVWNLIEYEPGLSSIRHIYYFKGKRVSDIALDIRSSRWRTWSYKALSSKRFIGTWRVDITSADGKLLESVQFEVT
jgi:DUF2914 family protein